MKRFMISIFVVMIFVFGVSILPVDTPIKTVCFAYQGETEDQFVSRVFYAQWMDGNTGDIYPFTRDHVLVDEIISCDVELESAFLRCHFVGDGKTFYSWIIKGQGMILYSDRARTNPEGKLVRMEL